MEAGRGCTEAVAVADAPSGLSVGSRFLLDEAGGLLDHLGADSVPGVVGEHLVPLGKRPAPYLQQGVAYLPVLPRITLLIVGGGHVGQAVATLAADVDFDIWVLDDRESYVSAQRFPTAQRRLTGSIGQMLQDLCREKVTPSVFALIVTRGHGHDEEALYHLATTQAAYVGMIGSKRKIKMIFEDLLPRGIPKEALDACTPPWASRSAHRRCGK